MRGTIIVSAVQSKYSDFSLWNYQKNIYVNNINLQQPCLCHFLSDLVI